MGAPAGRGLATLAAAVSGSVTFDPPMIAPLGRDASGLSGRPGAVLRPEGREDLVRAVRWARRTGIPLVARGGGTSLDGESVPLDGAVVLDFSGWRRILSLDPEGRTAGVEPGVAQPTLDAALRPHGLTYPPNPGSGAASTIGGHVATNASGPRSFRYGATRAWIRSLDVVDGRGRSWSAGVAVPKRSLGPDLVQALVGSEGTLALFAAIGLRLAPRPDRRLGLALPLPAEAPVGRWALALPPVLGAGTSAIEYVDGLTGSAIDPPLGDGAAEGGWLLTEVEGTDAEVAAAAARLEALRVRFGIGAPATEYAEADRLWERRGEAGPALQRRLGPGLREDVVVPPAAIDRLVAEIRALARAHRVEVALFGHLGEGNLHPTFGAPPTGPVAARLREGLLDRVLALGGAISGEHGIGATKRHRLADQLGAPGIGVLRALKAELDPDGILNPEKLLPGRAARRRSAASPAGAGAMRTPPGSARRRPSAPARRVAPGRRRRGARPGSASSGGGRRRGL